MKTIIKIVIVLFFCNQSISQIYYSNYLDATSEWRILEHNGPAEAHDCFFKTYFFDGFHNMNGYTYYEMYKTFYFIQFSLDYSTVYTQTPNQTQFIGYLREDVSGNFYINFGGSDILYMDNQQIMNAQIGDNFTAYYNGPATCPIDIVGTVLHNGVNLKQIKAGFITGGYSGNAVEGIGYVNHTCSLANYQTYSTTYFERIYCYSKQGQNILFYDEIQAPSGLVSSPLIYYTFPAADHQSLSNNEFENPKINLFPNPTVNNINIKSNSVVYSLSLFDLQGRMIKELKCNEKEVSFNIEDIQAGTYFLNINTDKGIKIEKIMKK
jgi:hypothetical protein